MGTSTWEWKGRQGRRTVQVSCQEAVLESWLVLPGWGKGTRKALLGRGGSKRKSIRAVNGLGVRIHKQFNVSTAQG